MGQSNAERQKAFRERRKALGQKAVNFIVSDDEAFYLERVLRSMRESGCLPAAMRDPKTGRYVHLDV